VKNQSEILSPMSFCTGSSLSLCLKIKQMRALLLFPILLILASCGGKNEEPAYDPEIAPPPPAPMLNYSVFARYPHDTGAYTQGLQWHKGKLFEGTGDYERSSIRITDLNTGKIEQIHKMGSNKIFGEGITILNGKIYQLTWQSNTVYVYDENNIQKPIKTLSWPYEGWGITHNGKQLIISDGSANLYFTDPETLKVLNTVAVTDGGRAMNELNELEYVDGYVYANVYTTPYILKIDPESGLVKGRLVLENMLQSSEFVPGRTDVLNGIAYDSSTHHFFITGKRWPWMFEVTLN